MKKHVLLAAAMAALLTACCASGVKLDDVPVEDQQGRRGHSRRCDRPRRPDPGGAGAGRPAAGDKAGPANVARIIYFDYDS
jgi:peptidoglycan-associated lipoprotein